jgi:Ser/Thr protein kinase RdoA (MazF antagonist)
VSVEGEPMPGGNTAPVVRLGDTVRRVPGPWTTNVAALMTGLRAAGVAGVPEHRGLDAQGREVVEFVEGDVPVYPMPPWVWTDEVLREVARAVRAVHDATTGLDLPLTGWRRPAVEPVEVVCHGDVAPYNCVFSGGRLVALIDWDHALPGPWLRDLGMAAYRFVSLTPPGHPDGAGGTAEQQWRRVAVLCEAYGGVEPRDVVRWALLHLDDLVSWAAERAAAGDAAAQATIDAGHSRLYVRDAGWVRSLLGDG